MLFSVTGKLRKSDKIIAIDKENLQSDLGTEKVTVVYFLLSLNLSNQIFIFKVELQGFAAYFAIKETSPPNLHHEVLFARLQSSQIFLDLSFYLSLWCFCALVSFLRINDNTVPYMSKLTDGNPLTSNSPICTG